jgi:hypothetical protein
MTVVPLLLGVQCGPHETPEEDSRTAPNPALAPLQARELNPNALPSMHFRAWHRSKGGIIVDSGMGDFLYLSGSGRTPVPFSDYEIDRYPLDATTSPTSPSGKYEVIVNEINGRVESSGCCAVQIFDHEVVLSERGRRTILASGPDAYWKVWGWSPDDRHVLFSDDGRLFLMDAVTRVTIPVGPDSSVMHHVFAAGGKSVFLIRSGDPAGRVERFDLATRQLTSLAPTGSEAKMLVSPDGQKLAVWFHTFTGPTTLTAKNRLLLFRAIDGAPTGTFDLPSGSVTMDSGWSADGERIGFTVGSQDYAYDVYSLDTRSGKVTRWYPPEGRTTALYKQE